MALLTPAVGIRLLPGLWQLRLPAVSAVRQARLRGKGDVLRCARLRSRWLRVNVNSRLCTTLLHWRAFVPFGVCTGGPKLGAFVCFRAAPLYKAFWRGRRLRYRQSSYSDFHLVLVAAVVGA